MKNRLIENLFKEELTGNSGFYCCVRLNNIGFLKNFLKQNFDMSFDTKYYPHCSIISSKKVPINNIDFKRENTSAIGYKFSILGNSLVILLKSKEINNMHNKWINSGCKHLYKDYIPHITIIDNVLTPYGVMPRYSDVLDKKFSVHLVFGAENFDDFIE